MAHFQKRTKQPKVGFVAVLALAILALAACSSNSPKAATPPPTPTPTASPSTQAATAAVAPSTSAPDNSQTYASGSTWNFSSTGSDGSTWTTTFTTGALVTGSALPTDPDDATLLTSCGVDPQRDAVIPWTVTETSTTPSFTITARAELNLADRFLIAGNNPAGTGQAVKYAAHYTGSTDCTTLSPDVSGAEYGIEVENDNLAPKATGTLHGILVLSGWASPAYPAGDITFGENVWIWVPDNANSSTGKWTVNTATGSGIIDLRSQTVDVSSGWYFPIDGTSKPDCSSQDSDLQAKCAAGAK